jgi:hypothetical protein
MPSKKPTTAPMLPTTLPQLTTPGLMPTPHLRWVNRGPASHHLSAGTVFPYPVMTSWRTKDDADVVVLQQWWDIPVQDFMRSAKKTGEWRIVETVEDE